MAGSGGLRLSDADREAAVDALADHYAVGRLDRDEFDERSDAVRSARTRADLAVVFADLGGAPGAAGRSAGDAGRRGARSWAFGWPQPVLGLAVLLIALTVVTHLPFVLFGVVAVVVLGRRRCWPGWHHRLGRP